MSIPIPERIKSQPYSQPDNSKIPPGQVPQAPDCGKGECTEKTDNTLTPLCRGYINSNDAKLDRERIAGILEIIRQRKDDHKVLVVGDAMLDYYMYCSETKLLQSQKHNVDEDYSFSKILSEKKRLGGAAHIAYACKAFSKNVRLFGVIGKDSQGGELRSEAQSAGIDTNLREIDRYLTITKMYIEVELDEDTQRGTTSAKTLKDGLKVIRINRELKEDDGEKRITPEKSALIKDFSNCIEEATCIIFKDHQKGFLSRSFLTSITSMVNDKKESNPEGFNIFIDPKYKWKKFDAMQVDAIIPNVKEAAAGAHGEKEDIISDREEKSALQIEDWNKLASDFDNIDCFVVTADHKGACLYRPGRDQEPISVPVKLDKTAKSEIGCGDVFDAYFIACVVNKKQIMEDLGMKQPEFFEYALRLANYAAGLKMCDDGSEIIDTEYIRKELIRNRN